MSGVFDLIMARADDVEERWFAADDAEVAALLLEELRVLTALAREAVDEFEAHLRQVAALR